MTVPTTLELDHVGFLVDDVNVVRRSLVVAGFDLGPLAELHGADGAPSGGVNCTTTFQGNYLEFQQLATSGREHPLEAHWDRRPCAAVLAFRSRDLDRDVQWLRAAGRHLSEAEHWSRETPAGPARVRFATFKDSPGGPLVIVVEHLTPDLTIGTGGIQPNGICALDGVVADGVPRPIQGPLDVPLGDQGWSMSRLRLRSTDPAHTTSSVERAGWEVGQGGTLDARALLGVDLHVVAAPDVR